MASINPVTREINFRVVYWGPALSGKTTNLVFIYEKLAPDIRGSLVSLATSTERTLFFDFFPLEIGEIGGFKTKFQLYTVPGQDYYQASRRLILGGVDGLVFVADSQKKREYDNIKSLRDLESTLVMKGMSFHDVPIVFQYNKRDLKDIMPVTVLDVALNKKGAPSLESIAIRGDGVMRTARDICKMVIEDFEGT